MSGPAPAGDRIEIRDLRLLGVHGVLPEERERAQPFSVDIVAWVDMAAAQESDALVDTVDYGALAQVAADVVSTHSFALVEALAGRLAAALHPPGSGAPSRLCANLLAFAASTDVPAVAAAAAGAAGAAGAREAR